MKKNTAQQLELEKGVKINAGFKQIIVAAFLIIVMLVLPIYVMENGVESLKFYEQEQNINPYSAQALRERNGEVAGISTEREASASSINIFGSEINLSFQNERSLPLLISGIVFITASVFLFLYLILGKFDNK